MDGGGPSLMAPHTLRCFALALACRRRDLVNAGASKRTFMSVAISTCASSLDDMGVSVVYRDKLETALKRGVPHPTRGCQTRWPRRPSAGAPAAAAPARAAPAAARVLGLRRAAPPNPCCCPPNPHRQRCCRRSSARLLLQTRRCRPGVPSGGWGPLRRPATRRRRRCHDSCGASPREATPRETRPRQAPHWTRSARARRAQRPHLGTRTCATAACARMPAGCLAAGVGPATYAVFCQEPFTVGDAIHFLFTAPCGTCCVVSNVGRGEYSACTRSKCCVPINVSLCWMQ